MKPLTLALFAIALAEKQFAPAVIPPALAKKPFAEAIKQFALAIKSPRFAL
jgi:hypothetical protein